MHREFSLFNMRILLVLFSISSLPVMIIDKYKKDKLFLRLFFEKLNYPIYAATTVMSSLSFSFTELLA